MNRKFKLLEKYSLLIIIFVVIGCDNPFSSDEEAPSILITFPSDGSIVTGVISVNADASDNEGVVKVEFSIDGKLKETDTETPWSYLWDSREFADGKTHTILAKAHDEEGNFDSSSVSLISVIVGKPELSVSPITLDFGDDLTELNVMISDSGKDTLIWDVSTEESWISVTPISGTTFGEIDFVKILVDRTNLQPADYIGIISVYSNGGNQAISATLTKSAEPTLSVSPQSLDFGGTAARELVIIKNSGTGTLNWTLSDDQDWLVLSQIVNTTTSESDSVYVLVIRTGLAGGEYIGNISISSNGGDIDLPVAMKVIEVPSLTVTPVSIDFGSTESISSATISNAGGDTLLWDLTVSEDWITVSPENGNTTSEIDFINIIINRDSLAQGNHIGFVTVTSNGGDQNISVSVNIESEPILDVTPQSLDFGEVELQKSLNITNQGAGTLNWTVSDDQGWITISPTTGATTTGTDIVNVTVDRTGLTGSDFTGTITINSDGGAVNISVGMGVSEAPVLDVSPLILDFDSPRTDSTFSIRNSGGGTLTWSILISSLPDWITLSPPEGSTTTESDSVNVSISRFGLASGEYNSKILISSVGDGGDTGVIIEMIVP